MATRLSAIGLALVLGGCTTAREREAASFGSADDLTAYKTEARELLPKGIDESSIEILARAIREARFGLVLSHASAAATTAPQVGLVGSAYSREELASLLRHVSDVASREESGRYSEATDANSRLTGAISDAPRSTDPVDSGLRETRTDITGRSSGSVEPSAVSGPRTDTDNLRLRGAENGSYFGQLNPEGRAKTVHVRGYYRRDGTYVRSHYRAPPSR